MKRSDLLQFAKPILFNTDMVRAILDGKKTVTRRVVKPQPQGYFEVNEKPVQIYDADDCLGIRNAPYQPDDILYVRESYCPGYFDGSIAGYRNGGMRGNRNAYKADYHADAIGDIVPEPKWTPSIHMPKEAARIWLKATDVQVERLQDITEEQTVREGINVAQALYDGWADGRERFSDLWNSTIKKPDLVRYGWDANPWVWVIKFERVVCE